MGVMPCTVASCDRVMCSRYLHDGIGYLCDDCFQKLRDKCGRHVSRAQVEQFQEEHQAGSSYIHLDEHVRSIDLDEID